MMLVDILTFFGHLHPMVVHLPIGFLILGATLNLLSYFSRYSLLRHAVPAILLAGFLSAIAACMLGYLLSLKGDYDQEILNNHKLSGILLALLSGILWSMTTSLYSRWLVIPPQVITATCVVVIALLTYTGHQGASLTHGSDYLSLGLLTHEERQKPVSAEEALIFEDVVHPLLEKRCKACHRRGKKKGELIMTTYDDLLKGGKHGPVVVPGNLAESELYRRITLDPDHEDFMPTDGKTPLTKTETELIRWWIEKAEGVHGRKMTSFGGHEAILPLVADVLDLPGAVPMPDGGLASARAVNPNIPATTNMTAVNNLRKKGLRVRVMLHAPVMLDVTLPAASNVQVRSIEKDLEEVAENVVWLNVSGNNLSETDLTILKQMINLEKLRLEKNPIGDGIVDLLVGLKYLVAANLNETRLSHKGLERLRQHSSLERIYTWKTAAQQEK